MNVIMTDFDFKRGSEPIPRKWEGLAELDHALAEDRLTAYRWKKTWADPWGRKVTIAVTGSIAVVFGFLIGASLGFW